jgi:hypothetical protein
VRNRVGVSIRGCFFLASAGFASAATADDFWCMASVKDGSRHYISGVVGNADEQTKSQFLDFAKSESGTPEMVVNCFPGKGLGEPIDNLRSRNRGREYFETQWTGPAQKALPATARSAPKKGSPAASGGSLTVAPASASADGNQKSGAKSANAAKPPGNESPANGKPTPGKMMRGFSGKDCDHARKVATSKGTFVETATEVSPKGSCIVQGWYTPNPNAAPRQ